MKFSSKIFLPILFSSFFLGISEISAQTSSAKKDTTYLPADSSKVFTFSEDNFPYGNSGQTILIENKLDNFQNYHPRQAGLGNAGSPEKQLSLPGSSSTAFTRSANNFSFFGYTPENRTFYSSKRPYTKLQYIVGQKQETNVTVIHAHPIGENGNIAFGFNRIRSTGFYQRQNTNNTSVDLNGWYNSPGKRYALLSDIYWTTENVAENGGIANDSNFDFAHQLDRHLVGVNLSAAETRQRMRGFWLKEYWSFGNVVDTISDKNDSVNIRTKIYPSWAIVHSTSLSDEKYVYDDKNPVSGFYPTIYRDSLETNDSTYLWRLQNALWLERFNYDGRNFRKLSGKIGIRQEVGEIKNDTIYKHFTNYIVDGTMNFSPKKKLMDELIVEGWYSLNGTNQGDYRARADFFSQELGNYLKYFISAQTSSAHPDFLYTNYSGNNFRWQNNFGQTGISNIRAGVSGDEKKLPLILSAGYYIYDSPVYFGINETPVQYHGSVKIWNADLSCFTGTKIFKLRSNISWNKIPNGSPIRLPEFIVRESAYSDFFLFKHALRMQIGVDVTWYSAYYADAYNPAIAQFYVQNTKSIGNYVYLDPFVSLKIKPVHIFVKADHLNAGWFGRTYYQVPHYPGNDFALKFGMSWVFND